jgi:hypothetical protein
MRCEALSFNRDSISPVRKPLQTHVARFIGAKYVSALVSIADNFDRGPHPQSGRIGHREMQFATPALAEERQRKQEEKSWKSFH